MATPVIDYTLIAYQSALQDWEKESSIHTNTEGGFCGYFHQRHCLEYTSDNFPELFALGESHQQYQTELFYQWPSTGLFPLGRRVRLNALRLAIRDRELKANHKPLNNHYTTRSIIDMEDLRNVLKTERWIYVSDWGRLMPCKFFLGAHWYDETLKTYVDQNSFWLAKEKTIEFNLSQYKPNYGKRSDRRSNG